MTSKETTAQKLLDAEADGMEWMTLKAQAQDYLRGKGETDLPGTKAELIALLEIYAEDEKEPVAETAVAPANGVEVILKHKYAPRYLMSEDGEWTEQRNDNPKTLPAGATYLHPDDAEKAIANGQVTMTERTMAQLRSAG